MAWPKAVPSGVGFGRGTAPIVPLLAPCGPAQPARMFAKINGRYFAGNAGEVFDYIWRYRSVHGPVAWTVTRTATGREESAARASKQLAGGEPLPDWLISMLSGPSLTDSVMAPLEREVAAARRRRADVAETA